MGKNRKFKKEVTVFAPASVGNIGPGFDVLGLAVTGLGDWVKASRTDGKNVRIVSISGTAAKLPMDPRKNTVGIAATEVLRVLGIRAGVDLFLHKNIPGNGLGSSAASAVAAGYAINRLFGNPLDKTELLLPCAKAESRVSGGFFLDNISASLLGGVVLTNPKTLFALSIGTIPRAVVVLVTPSKKLLTKRARKVLPKGVPFVQAIQNMAFSCALVAAVARRDVHLFGQSIQDVIVEPRRSVLIPGFYDVKKAALKNGAMGCSISGAGSTVFALTDDRKKGERIGKAMQTAFRRQGLDAVVTLSRIDDRGARPVHSGARTYFPRKRKT